MRANDRIQKPATILSKLPQLSRSPEFLRYVPILLVTPAFAPWAQTHNKLLPSLLRHVFRDAMQTSEKGVDLYTVSAIVDKLPLFGSSSHREDSLVMDQMGSEGITLLLTDLSSLSGDVVRSSRKRDVSMPEIDPSITYATTHVENGGELITTEIGVRVANTIFVTGKPRTMMASKWHIDPITETVKLKQSQDLAICRIESSTESSVATPCVPLHPVTEPRTVHASMGNVLSQISASNGSGKSAPASAELEKAIPAYVKKHQLENRRLAVWALVKRAEDTPLDPEDVIDISHAIRNGARLHRLMSGGGGWGKKQGLLSLDPEYSYQEEHHSGHRCPLPELFGSGSEVEYDFDELPFDTFPDLMELSNGKLVTPLSEAAKPGDTVQFFVAPLDTGVSTREQEHTLPNPEVEGSCIFGVVSPADTEFTTTKDTGREATPGEELNNNLIVLPNCFGALSEKGVTFTVIDERDSRRSRKLELSGTKVDVPGSRISIEGQFK